MVGIHTRQKGEEPGTQGLSHIKDHPWQPQAVHKGTEEDQRGIKNP